MAKEPYVIVEFVSTTGKTLVSIKGEVGAALILDPAIEHDAAVISEIENGMKEDALQERKDEEHISWNFEKAMRKYYSSLNGFMENPAEAFPDMRYAPETILFQDKSAADIIGKRVRSIIQDKVPENLQIYFLDRYGKGLTNTEIARKDGVSETARRKFDRRLKDIVRKEYIARYGTFSPA